MKWRVVFGAALAALLVLVPAGFAAWRWLGVEGLYFDHVIATVEVSGAESKKDARQLKLTARSLEGLREVSSAQSAWSEDAWIVRLQFRARDTNAARRLLEKWIEATPSVGHVRLIKAVYFRCRVHRSAGGDLVFGDYELISFD